ncbi:MAG: hypothetical protein ACM3TR_06430 [Caulobacteraceae bacterium]
MKALVGNNMNIFKQATDTFIGAYSSIPSEVISAQHILSTQIGDVTPQQLQQLSQQLYKSVVKSSLEDGEYLHNATRVVIDWNRDVNNVSFARFKMIMRSIDSMQSLLNWQKELAIKIRENKETKAIHFFNKNGIEHVWVIVEKPTFDLIVEYSDIYMNYLDINNDALCEFMVYGVNEVCSDNLPENTKSLY